jgi:hypothetical protein
MWLTSQGHRNNHKLALELFKNLDVVDRHAAIVIESPRPLFDHLPNYPPEMRANLEEALGPLRRQTTEAQPGDLSDLVKQLSELHQRITFFRQNWAPRERSPPRSEPLANAFIDALAWAWTQRTRRKPGKGRTGPFVRFVVACWRSIGFRAPARDDELDDWIGVRVEQTLQDPFRTQMETLRLVDGFENYLDRYSTPDAFRSRPTAEEFILSLAFFWRQTTSTSPKDTSGPFLHFVHEAWRMMGIRPADEMDERSMERLVAKALKEFYHFWDRVARLQGR